MVVVFVFVAITSAFFIVVGLAFLREGLTAPTHRVRNLALLVFGLSLQFATGAAWAAGIEAGRLGWISTGAAAFIQDWLGLAVEIFALGFGVTALVVVMTSDSALHKAVRMTSILSRRFSRLAPLVELDLTAREVQVLELMAKGVHSDDGLAAELSISPATAATHIRNIMGKAQVSRRQDLLLLGDTVPREAARGTKV